MSKDEAAKILSSRLYNLIDKLSDESDYCNEGKIDVSEDFEERSEYADALRISIESLKTEVRSMKTTEVTE